MRGKQDHSRERELRRQQTEAERMLWQRLRDRRLAGFKFRRQHRVGPYYADFLCAEARLIVELDGSQHLDQSDHDVERTRFLESLGYRVLRFWNDESMARMEDVLNVILKALHTPHPAAAQPPSPREAG